MKGITVQLKNFAAFKGRADNKHNSWFRCSNRLLEDPDFYEFTTAELLVWIYILSLASQKNSDTVFINFERADRISRLKKRDILSAIEKLEVNQLVPLQDPASNPQVSDESATNNTNNTNNTSPPALGFTDFYKVYPRKEKPGLAEKKYKALIKAGTSHETIMQALTRYQAHLVRKKIGEDYYKLPTTFLGEVDDWLDPQNGTTKLSSAASTNYNEMAAEVWRWANNETDKLDQKLFDLVERLGGYEHFKHMHRDDFRPAGIVPGLLKQAAEKAAS